MIKLIQRSNYFFHYCFLFQSANGRFKNQPLLTPITANYVMERHQIDFEGVVYRYVMTLQDIFSRFLWLRPLIRKKSSSVAFELTRIYREHGPPKILQCDNGGEFKKYVMKAVQSVGVKIIRSRAYHPQSQRKVERSHRTLRDRIEYDLR